MLLVPKVCRRWASSLELSNAGLVVTISLVANALHDVLKPIWREAARREHNSNSSSSSGPSAGQAQQSKERLAVCDHSCKLSTDGFLLSARNDLVAENGIRSECSLTHPKVE